MEVIPKCFVSVIVLFALLSFSGLTDADCNHSCLEASGNETEPACNVTTKTCIYGCQEGYVGDRCQFKCAYNCSNCRVNECTENCNGTCDNGTCYQNETCIQGCLDGLYGLNCSIPCPENCQNFTCHRENGTCSIGCKDGFYGDSCEKRYTDLDCNLSCQDAPDNTMGPVCNETSLACLFGCQEGYVGERCQFVCEDNCSSCTADGCPENCNGACNTGTCFQNQTCIQGCLDGLYGLNCSIPCPENCKTPTCHRENGTCSTGCKDKYFGDQCENNCTSICEKTAHVKDVTCDDKTLKCLYTCNQGYAGDRCQYNCDYNCLECGTVLIKENKVNCELCYPNYYDFNNRCEKCSGCLEDPNGNESSCYKDGSCVFGCKHPYWGLYCKDECSNFCIKRACARNDGCCTEKCTKDFLGGCRCEDLCPTDCLEKKCYQNETCKSCPVNRWGLKCNMKCRETCKNDSNPDTAYCKRNGNCLFGCVKTFWGSDCSQNCSQTCIERDCDNYTGKCLQGCEKSFWGDNCDKECATNCLESDCHRVNATCKHGCINGYYGMNCSIRCPANCLNDTCFSANGTCTHGCVADYTGDRCDTQKSPTTERPEVDFKFIAITAGGSGGGFIALIIAALILRNRYVAYRETVYMKEKNRKTKMEQDNLRKKRKDRQSMAVGVMSPLWNFVQPDTVCEGVLSSDELMDHLIKTDLNGYAEEFQKLPENVENRVKNKRKSPYKASKRVRIALDDGIPMNDLNQTPVDNVVTEDEVNEAVHRDYNASAIEVYSKRYIVAEGPSSSTIVDFWRVVWQERSPIVVMLAPTSINKHSSCIRYWPEKDKTEIYGKISITNVKEEVFAHFVYRELNVVKNEETRTIRQLQLSLWPDAKQLPNIADFINFYIHFRSISMKETEPVLVHCSDGEGRTGVFVAMDILVKEGETIRKVNFLDCVKSLREQRDNMVQTKEQYQYLYSIVAHTLQIRCKPVSEENFVNSYQESHQSLESNPLITYIEDSYENLRAAVIMKPVDTESMKKQWNLKKKNREGADMPEDQYRPALPGGAYINAVYIDTLKKKGLIITQMPLSDTIADFYKLVVAENCRVIVMLNTPDPKDKTSGIYWPVKGTKVEHGNVSVSIEETSETEDYKLIKLIFWERSRKDLGLPVSLFQFTNWESGKFRPTDTTPMLKLIQAVQTEQEIYDSGPVIAQCLSISLFVMCMILLRPDNVLCMRLGTTIKKKARTMVNNGSERSGLFCALYELTDAINREYEFSVATTVYKIKNRRPSAILNLDQFKFIHEALETYITKDEFRGEPVQSMEIPVQLIPEADED